MSTINSVTAAAYTTTAYESTAAAKKENTEATTEKSYGKDVGVVYEKSSKTVENAGTYKKTSGKTNTALIEKMKADTANRTNQLRSMVEQMMTKQGKKIGQADDIWSFLASGKYNVSPEVRAQAQKDIADDGYWGVEQTSDRIVEFAKALSGGLGESTPLFCTSDSWAYAPDAKFYEYDPDLAKQMLAEAGYPNGFETTIYTKAVDNDTATAFQAILAQIGIKAEVNVMDSSALAAIQKEDDIDGFIANRGASKMDFTNNYIRLYSSEGIKNHGIMLRPAEFEEPLFAARAAKTIEEKKANLQKAAKALVQDYVMITPMAVVYYETFAVPGLEDSGIYDVSLEQWTPEAVHWTK